MNLTESLVRRHWLAALAIAASFYFVYMELGNVVEGEVDQGTLYYLYNTAFYKQFIESVEFPQWNPYIQSGVSHHANLPFPLSLGNLVTLITGDGIVGYFVARGIILSISSCVFLALLRKMNLRTGSILFTLFLFLAYQRSHNSHDAIGVHVAIVLTYAFLAYGQHRKVFVLGLAGLFLGIALNDFVSQGIFAVLPFHLLLVFFLRHLFDWKVHLCAILAVWAVGVLLALPTIVPQIIDVQESTKIFSPQADLSRGLLTSLRYYILTILVMKLSPGLIIPLTIAFGAPFVYWHTFSDLEKGIVKTAFCIILSVLAFYLIKGTMASWPLIGSTLAAFDAIRLMFVVHFCFEVMFAVSVERVIYHTVVDKKLGWQAVALSAVFVLLLAIWSYYKYIVLLGGILAIIYGQNRILRVAAFTLLAIVFARSWYYSEIIATGLLPDSPNPFQTLNVDQMSIFPGETPKIEAEMVDFLRDGAKREFFETAELRDHPLGYDMFQRYPYWEIPTIHGFSNIRLLRPHMLYIWMLEDVRDKSPDKYTHLLEWGNFANNFGSRFDTELLNLMGVRYLVADRAYADDRFIVALEGDKYRILENQGAFPRAFAVSSFRVFDSVEEIGVHMRNASAEALRDQTVFLKGDLSDTVGELASLVAGPEARGSDVAVEILGFDSNSVEIKVDAATPSILVLTQAYHYGWRARVNGEESNVYPAYYAFLSTTVPAGESTVEFEFGDPAFAKSLYVALFALFSLLTLIVFGLKQQAKPQTGK
jgi:hypothetical protein